MHKHKMKLDREKSDGSVLWFKCEDKRCYTEKVIARTAYSNGLTMPGSIWFTRFWQHVVG